MIARVFLRNLRHLARLLAALAVLVAAAEVMFVLVAGVLETGPGIADLVRLLPPAAQSAFGARLALASFNAAVGFGFQHPVILIATLGFVVVACSIPAGERETGTIDLILARPVPRWRYLAGVAGVALLGVMVLPSALVVGCAIGLAIVSVPSALSWSRYLGSAAGLASLLLAFLGLALLIGARVRRRGLAASRVAGLTVTLYLLDVFGERLAWLAWLRWTSPFRYFRSVPVALTGDWPVTHLLALVGVGLVAGALGFWRFGRGDSTG